MADFPLLVVIRGGRVAFRMVENKDRVRGPPSSPVGPPGRHLHRPLLAHELSVAPRGVITLILQRAPSGAERWGMERCIIVHFFLSL